MNWHTMDNQELCSSLQVDPLLGLTPAEASRRLASHGANELLETGGISPWRILIEQLTSTMALILIMAAALSLAIGSIRDALTIMAIVCMFALLGFVQEYRAEQAMRALKRLAVPVVKGRRLGTAMEIAARELVAGDIVLLEAGNMVPADCRLLEAYALKTQEALLTGEAGSVNKHASILTEEILPVTDKLNMVWMGTTVTAGRGVALVVATGMVTELGRIAGMLQSVHKEWTPLQKRLDRLGKNLAGAAVAIAAMIFALGVWRGEPLSVMLMTAVSLAVAAIPEGLPAVVTITLAIGAQRLLKKQALIRKLPAVETLGSVTVICTDKTGTLTENRMTVTQVTGRNEIAPSADNMHTGLLRMAYVLCNDASLQLDTGKETVIGDPTEGALLQEAAAHGLYRPELETKFPRMAEIPFESATKRMLTIHSVSAEGAQFHLLQGLALEKGDRLLFAKGAPATIISVCPDDQHLEKRFARLVDDQAAQGGRVLAIAFRVVKVEEQLKLEECWRGLTLLGLVTMMDPPRKESYGAVARCLSAGIRPVMITGDHPLTAVNIANQVGIMSRGGVLTGRELEQLGQAGIIERIGEVSIYSMVSPEQKLMLVKAFQDSGEVVAMTGDGVNDAPALRKASIGVAMGISGTDVAKEAADMVLLDDNFATIVAAVEEGRTIYDNIRKFIEFSVAGNLGKILAVLILPFLGLPNPLTPLQLLWLNLLTDGLLGLGMGVEKPEPDIMKRPPISPAAQIFDPPMIRHTFLAGGIIGTTTILLTNHYWTNHQDGTWQTLLFTSLAFAQIGQALSLRSFNHSLLSIGFFSNRMLTTMCCLVVALQLTVVYTPALQPYFRTTGLTLSSLIWVLLPGLAVFLVLEGEKMLRSSQRP